MTARACFENMLLTVAGLALGGKRAAKLGADKQQALEKVVDLLIEETVAAL